ncbi:MAG: TraB/GumN family protein, partial [Burkholderia gladioli]
TEAQLQNVFLKKKGARVVGLETLAEQMRAFTGLTLAEQREMLAQDITQTPAQNADDIKALHRLWRIGDADAVSAWANAKTERLAHSRPLAAAIDNKIVYERNRRFTARAIALAGPNRPLFVAIGALHLGGPKGVIELLKRQGFRVDAG